MLAQPFLKPVHVWVGLGFPGQLNTVADAYQFAADWSGNSPGAAERPYAPAGPRLRGYGHGNRTRRFHDLCAEEDILIEDMTRPVTVTNAGSAATAREVWAWGWLR